MRAKITASLAIAGVVALGLLAYVTQNRTHEMCPLCGRSIHAESRAVIEVAGERKVVCCARCGLTAKAQKNAPARLVEVSDFASGRALAPDDAYYVENTPVVICDRHQPPVDAHKKVFTRVFDRCEPSVFAFASREDAESFIRKNGGQLRRFAQLSEEVGTRP